MRVPIPVVILLCLCVVGGVWWAGTREHDFLTPPSGIQTTETSEKTDTALPSAEEPPNANEAQKNPEPQENQPKLADYRDEAMKNPAALVEKARQLEIEGKLQHSLLAWERILDSATPDEIRTAEAIQAIKRLRAALPPWNSDPAKTIAITLHAATSASIASMLAPTLEEIARDLEQASSGILKITAKVSPGPDFPPHRGAAPVALWLAGQDAAKPISSETIVFMSGTPETLRQDVLKKLGQFIGTRLSRNASLNLPGTMNPEESPTDFIQTRVTRLDWLELGTALNKSLEQSGIHPTR